jgi:hypothetical protein
MVVRKAPVNLVSGSEVCKAFVPVWDRGHHGSLLDVLAADTAFSYFLHLFEGVIEICVLSRFYRLYSTLNVSAIPQKWEHCDSDEGLFLNGFSRKKWPLFCFPRRRAFKAIRIEWDTEMYRPWVLTIILTDNKSLSSILATGVTRVCSFLLMKPGKACVGLTRRKIPEV